MVIWLGFREGDRSGGGTCEGACDCSCGRTDSEIGDDTLGTDEVFKLPGKDQASWGAMGYIYM